MLKIFETEIFNGAKEICKAQFDNQLLFELLNQCVQLHVLHYAGI